MSYEYDVFISYRRQSPVLDWVANHLHPLLEHWVPQFLPQPVTIFRDSALDVGAHWPSRLSAALQRSKCLVAVWSPPYFQSHWCVAEWASMEQRERDLGYFSAANPAGLALPVVFADGLHFPAAVRARQYRDLHRWNHPYAAFRDTAKYIDFDCEVQAFAEELANAIMAAPPWQPAFPALTPDPAQPPNMLLPRL